MIALENNIVYCKNCRNQIVPGDIYNGYCSDLCKKQDEVKKKKDKLSLKEFAIAFVIPTVTYLVDRANFIGETDMQGKLINYYNISGFNNSLKDQILERDEYMCRICSKRTNLHIHHIIPRSQGGSHEPDNLITLCSSCHGAIETRDKEYAINKCTKNFLKEKPKHLSRQEIIALNLSNRVNLEFIYEMIIEISDEDFYASDKTTILKEFAEIIELYE